jgi:hypothetical protein
MGNPSPRAFQEIKPSLTSSVWTEKGIGKLRLFVGRPHCLITPFNTDTRCPILSPVVRPKSGIKALYQGTASQLAE